MYFLQLTIHRLQRIDDLITQFLTLRGLLLFVTLFCLKFRYGLEDGEKMWAWISTLLVLVAFGLVAWAYRRGEEKERFEA
jgi:hypothetical protein